MEELLRAAHTAGIRMVLDSVFNHASREDYRYLHADNDYNVHAFARQGERETLTVVLNNGTKKYDLDWPAEGLFLENSFLTDIWGDASARVANGCITQATMSSASGAILVRRGEIRTKAS